MAWSRLQEHKNFSSYDSAKESHKIFWKIVSKTILGIFTMPRVAGTFYENFKFCPTIVSNENKTCLVTQVEIRVDVFDRGGLKPWRPDRYLGIFYQSAWEVVGERFLWYRHGFRWYKLYRSCFDSKVANPELVSQYRPIGLCNFCYKVISKVKTNKMKHILSKIISENQRAFVPRRLIQNNILIAHETFHY